MVALTAAPNVQFASSAMSTRDARGRFTASGAPRSATGGSGSDGDDDNTGGDGPAVPQGGATDAKPEHALSYRTEVKFDSFIHSRECGVEYRSGYR